jgi:uncharacterized protein YqeY
VSLADQVRSDVRTAMKSGDAVRRDALRLLLSSLQGAEKDARRPLSAEEEVAVLRRERKRRLEAAEAYRDAGSEDRAGQEEAEAVVIEAYLPAELGDEELAAIVDAAVATTGASSMRDMGGVMREAMAAVAGRADGRRVQAVVRERLA